jgi:hypothetical protein
MEPTVMSALLETHSTLRDGVGELGYELGRYAVSGGGERVLCGRRVNGEAIVIDAPAGSEGRVYLVERGVEQDGSPALKALVADYIETATALGRIPMATSAPVTGTRSENLGGSGR